MMFNKRMVTDLDVEGKKVIVRVDFNVPIKEGKIKDDTRITAALPTINYLLDHGASVILMSHLGRPKTKEDLQYSLKPVADHLATLVNAPVKFAADCRGEIAKEASANLKPGEVLVLENTRFYPEESKNDLEMSKDLASLADLYVNDAFGSAHRAHSSTAGIADYLPAAAGFLMEKEIKYLGNAIADPVRPFVALTVSKTGNRTSLHHSPPLPGEVPPTIWLPAFSI
jgi:phosphoglycerate kinase